MTGKIKFYDSAKGYGFIQPDDGADDHFLHHTGLLDKSGVPPCTGDKVAFKSERGPRGMKAIKASITERAVQT